MKFRYLGTSAGEGIPAVFCECETCKKAVELAGKNIRTRSQALIDDKLLIDLGPDTFLHSLKYGIRLCNIKNCLITHSHPDHLYPNELKWRNPVSAYIENKSPLTIYSDQSGYDLIEQIKKSSNKFKNYIELKKVELYNPFYVDEYEVTALRANHAASTSPVIYLIKKDNKSVLYCHDTNLFQEETIDYLKQINYKINLISLDCTLAANDIRFSNGGHMSIFGCDEFINQLKSIGLVDEDTKIILSHFSHIGKNVLYDDFVSIAANFGFEVSYDGMEIEI